MTASVSRPAGSVFISYRREDSAYAASFLFNLLETHFGKARVFWDVDSIQLGDDFPAAIQAGVGRCRVMLAFIGDRWLTITGKDGKPRLEDPNDFVRLEIEAGLTRDIRVIPVLINGARMPSANQVPTSLARLEHLQAFELSASHFQLDAARLIKLLDGFIEAEATRPMSLTGPLPVRLAPDEKPVITVRSHPAVLIVPFAIVFIALAAAGFLTTTTSIHHTGGVIAIIWGLWLAVTAWSATKVIAWAREYLLVTSERILHISGVLGRIAAIPLSKVTDLSFHKPWPGRILGYGDVIIETASQDVSLRRINHLPYPEQLFLEIANILFQDE
jgi:TIR domain/Bacterial PH domain